MRGFTFTHGMRQATASLAVLVMLLSVARTFGAEAAAVLNEALYLGKPVVVENVTVWPVYASRPTAPLGEYVTLAQAQEKNQAVVREKGAPSPAAAPAQPVAPQAQAAEPQTDAGQQVRQVQEVGGQVNELVIENKGAVSILVLAGTLVKGGKQDRQIAQDFVVPPGQTVPVGAFCVEHGRWTAQREGQGTDGLFVAQKTLANGEVRQAGQYKADQQEVWNQVSAMNSTAHKAPATGTLMASVDETDQEALARRARLGKALSERFVELCKEADAPVGVAYAIDGKIKEVRTFAHPKIYALYSETLLNTVTMEGELAQRKALANKQAVYKDPAEAKKVVELIQEVAKLKEERVKTQAGNENGYQKSTKYNSSNCYIPNAAEKGKEQSVSQTWAVSE